MSQNSSVSVRYHRRPYTTKNSTTAGGQSRRVLGRPELSSSQDVDVDIDIDVDVDVDVDMDVDIDIEIDVDVDVDVVVEHWQK